MALVACGPKVPQPVTVTDCSSKEPIKGAAVRVQEGAPGLALVVTDLGDTDDKGRVSVDFPAKGSSKLVVSQDGFKEVQKDLSTAPSGPLEVCLQPQ